MFAAILETRGLLCTLIVSRLISRTSMIVLSNREGNVVQLVKLNADLSRVPKNEFLQEFGADNKMYYEVHFEIEVTYFSAYTKYELFYDDVNYGAVSAEYI